MPRPLVRLNAGDTVDGKVYTFQFRNIMANAEGKGDDGGAKMFLDEVENVPQAPTFEGLKRNLTQDAILERTVRRCELRGARAWRGRGDEGVEGCGVLWG